ncbi:hypothetical protein C3747_4g779 [Trypanosoma cruzi]|nr:hypothetical protein C3747_4g779 [Trypanosoma cruzi]RNC49202.1 putative zinc finger protein [Trypanosoma cruzi]
MSIRLSVLGEWKSDSSVQKCEICEVKFNLGCRRHHCRYCGGIFCASCSSFFVKLQKLHVNKRRRVCHKCFEFLSKTPQATNPSCASVQSHHKELNSVNACNCESDPLTTESAQATTVVSWTPRRGEDRNTAGTFPDVKNADDADLDDDDDDVSAAVAGVYSSMDDGQHTGSLAFLAALQDNLRYSEGSDVIHVLIYVSATRYQVILVTVSDGETMLMLARRLVDVYFRLDSGSFKSISTVEREILLQKLRFSSESIVIENEANASDVASHCKHLVLSTLSVSELQRAHGGDPIEGFFRSELCNENKDGMIC